MKYQPKNQGADGKEEGKREYREGGGRGGRGGYNKNQ